MDPDTYTGPPKVPDVFYFIPKLAVALNFTHPHYGDPNYVPENIGGILYGLSIGTMVVAGIAVLARLLTRVFLVWGFGLDDWVIGFATLLCLGLTIVDCLCTTLGKFGLFVYDMTLDDLIISSKLYFSHFILYYATLMMVKTSILLFYRRLLGNVQILLQRFIIGLFIFNIFLTVAQIVQLLLSCRPTRAVYDPVYQANHPEACGWGTTKQLAMTRLAYYVMMPCHLLIDILILLLPVKMVFRLSLPPAQKIAVRFLFGLGLFACVACAVRLYYVYRMVVYFSPFNHPHFDVICWGQVEATVSLMVACAPSIRPLFTRILPRLLHRQQDSHGQLYPRSSTSDRRPAARSTSATYTTGRPGTHTHAHALTGHDRDLADTELESNLSLPDHEATHKLNQHYGRAYPYPKRGVDVVASQGRPDLELPLDGQVDDVVYLEDITYRKGPTGLPQRGWGDSDLDCSSVNITHMYHKASASHGSMNAFETKNLQQLDDQKEAQSSIDIGHECAYDSNPFKERHGIEPVDVLTKSSQSGQGHGTTSATSPTGSTGTTTTAAAAGSVHATTNKLRAITKISARCSSGSIGDGFSPSETGTFSECGDQYQRDHSGEFDQTHTSAHCNYDTNPVRGLNELEAAGSQISLRREYIEALR